MSDKKDKKLYPQLSSEEETVQPPPYTPSTAPSSPAVGPSAPLQPPHAQHYMASPPPPPPQQPPHQPPLQPQQQPGYSFPYIHPSYHQYQPVPTSASSPPSHQHHHHHQQHHAPATMSSPLILMKPPTRIQDLGPKPGVVVCPHCHYLVLTETEPEAGSCTYLSILTLLLLGITSCGCCLLPLCVTSGKDMLHSCPNCNAEIGLYSRLKGRTIPAQVV